MKVFFLLLITFALLNGCLSASLDLTRATEAEQFLEKILNDKSKEVPDEVDWRKVEGRVGPVRDGGDWSFRGDWALALTGMIEGQMVVDNLTMVTLSPQNLLDCLDHDWVMSNQLNNLAKLGGIESEEWYPYIAAYNYRCMFNRTRSIFSIKGGVALPYGDESKLKEVVAKYGPVAAAFDSRAGEFFYYKTGVYSSDKCENNIPWNHVLIVGYGVDPKEGEYWLVRNNWGDAWGDKGYFKIARNRNLCGIASFATIATF